jgi:hypothetical protein
MSCIQCENLKSCGIVNNYLRDYGKAELVKRLNQKTDLGDCKDFSFIAISGTVLRDKILEMVELSKAKKLSLKSKLKTK